MSKPIVLAVDDTPGNLIALEAVLAREYELVLATSGEEAVRIMESRRDVDVVLMDVQMPGMDGFAAASAIKKVEHARDVPIIFITAIFKEDPFVRRGYEAGAVDYFCKPFDPDILRMKVGVYSSFRRRDAFLKERERQLQHSEELLQVGRRLSSVLESLPVGVLVADVDGRVLQSNEEVSRICKAIEPMRRDAYGEVLGWWDAGGHLLKDEGSPLARALRDGTTSHNQVVEIRCFDGSPKTVLCSASPLHGVEAGIVGAVVVIQDITEPRKLGADLETRLAQLISLGVELDQVAKH